MPRTDQDQTDRDETPPDPPLTNEICIARITEPEILDTYSLVLSAADVSHRVRIHSSTHMELYVAQASREKAMYEIFAYTQENQKVAESDKTEDDFIPTFRAMGPLLIGGLFLMYGVSGDWQPDSYWFIKGAGNSSAILNDFALYRLVTPLTLHADLVHLLSNCFFGIFLLHYFLHLTGNGIGLAALLLTSAAANLINVLVHGPGHLFVGFSTAIFSIIGMLATINFIGKSSRFSFNFLMPVMAGLALLAFLGSAGERTDLGSHLFGLLCGLLAGNFVRSPFYSKFRSSFVLQILLSTLTFLIIWGCWQVALS